jgi:hypothetical protein
MNTKQIHNWCLLALGVAILVALGGLIAHVIFEFSGVMHGDTMIFQTVGRGILNGIKPYSGLFETKPPGIFLMHAVSLWIFDSQFLVKLLQVLALVSIPVLVVIPSVNAAASRPPKERQIITLVSVLFGLVLALYTANQAGQGLVEGYGAATALLYLLLLDKNWKQWVRLGVLGFLMLITVGLKEPFVLVLLSCVLIMRKNVLQAFVYPLVVAIVFGFIALLVLGYIEPFFGVYLPHMFGFHVHQHDVSLPLRALEVWRVFMNMGAYSWWLAIGFTVLLGTPFFDKQQRSRASVLRYVFALYIMMCAIAAGGDFYGHHFIFAVPCYVALYWWLLRTNAFGRKYFCIFGALLCVTAFAGTRFVHDYAGWRTLESEYISVSSTIDSVMDNCGYDRYLQMIARGGGPYTYTSHSPYGPIFVHYSRFIGGSKMYQSEHIRALQETPLVFILDIENSNLTEMAQEFVGAVFTEDAPKCAGEGFVQPSPYHLLFRQE